MPETESSILEPPPAEIAAEIQRLNERMESPTYTNIPPKILDRNLLVATWNLREFGSLTRKWASDPKKDSPKRDLHALLCIAEIIRHFDVIAIQEVTGNLRALRDLMKCLGDDWSFLMTDAVNTKEGGNERLAFVFDTRRVQLSGLACELVVPEELKDKGIGAAALRRQFARTPYAVSFRSGKNTFILVTLHVLYGKKPEERIPELSGIAEWLAAWAKQTSSYGHNLIALGDFNIDRKDDPLYQAFTATGLRAPADLNSVPRTLVSDPGKPDTSHFYDQIAWFTGENGVPELTLNYSRGGSFRFEEVALASRNLPLNTYTFYLSDHYPLWVEFNTRESQADAGMWNG